MSGDRVDFGLDGLAPCAVEVKGPRLIASLEELRTALGALSGDGWVCLTDRVERWRGGASDGIPLSAELCIDASRSVHLRRGASGWTLTEYAESPVAGSPEGADTVVEERSFECSAPRDALADVWPAQADYRAYYRRDDDGVLRPYVARFAGWRKKA